MVNVTRAARHEIEQTPTTTDDGAAVVLRGVSKHYGDAIALHPLDLTINDGEFLTLLGPSGCGKTTTLKLIGGFEEPTTGSVLIGGTEARHTPPHKRDVNTVFQNYALFPHMNVLDNVAYGLKQRGVDRRERRAQALEALDMVSLANRAAARPTTLSGGQQQRVALARALVLRPKVLLLDEPLGALDLKLRQQMQIELKRIHRDVGITFVFVTHDQSEALSMSDRVAVMSAGRIEQLDAPEVIYDSPATSFVATFIGEMNVLTGVADSPEVGTVPGMFTTTIGHVSATAAPKGGVELGVRPNDVLLITGADVVENATVGEVMTIGHQVQFVSRLDDGQQIIAVKDRYGHPAVAALRAGDRVRLEPEPGTTILLGPVQPTPHPVKEA